jgi:hypothetical protein
VSQANVLDSAALRHAFVTADALGCAMLPAFGAYQSPAKTLAKVHLLLLLRQSLSNCALSSPRVRLK